MKKILEYENKFLEYESKRVAPDYGTLVPLFAWRIKRNDFKYYKFSLPRRL